MSDKDKDKESEGKRGKGRKKYLLPALIALGTLSVSKVSFASSNT